jgi:hypothetical protein
MILLDGSDQRLAVQQIASDESQMKCSSSNLHSPIAGASCFLVVIQLRKDLRHWLSSPDPSTNHYMARNARHKGTSEWFLESDTFKQWKSSKPKDSLLWVHGKRVSIFLPSRFDCSCSPYVAGSGKSVLWFVFLTNSYLSKLMSA